ncbi:hypothetical protein C8R46DRAFT_1096214 [Mycena filopes]|nr:hypothetical protein C8R46DRAFT_1096214 [Mycena filopes]
MATPEPVKLLLGPILIGSTLNTFLYGVCASQFLAYYLSKARLSDSRIIRYMVAWEFIIDTFHSAVAVYFLWIYMVDNFLNASFLQTAPWTVSAVPIVTALSACPIQTFLAWRVYQLSKSWYKFGLLVVLTAANVSSLSASRRIVYLIRLSRRRFDDGARLTPLVDVWLSVSVVNDLAITVLLVYHLNKGRTGLSKTDSVVRRLIRAAIESAAFATFFSIMVLVMFTRFPATGFHLLFSQPVGRIYTSTLNRRDSFRQELGGVQDLPDLRNSHEFHTLSTRSRAPVAVKITQETVREDHSFRKGDSI